MNLFEYKNKELMHRNLSQNRSTNKNTIQV